MDLSKTVFILGAGSSKPYDFPTGEELKKQIIKFEYSNLNDSYGELRNLLEKNYYLTKETQEKFCKALARSGSASIDTFLNNYSDDHLYSIIGKTLITFFISSLSLKNSYHRQDWIEYYIKRFISYDRDNYEKNPPTIISFNYDRLFEHKIASNYTLEANRNHAPEIEITHIYGKVDLNASLNGCPNMYSDSRSYLNKEFTEWIDGIISDSNTNLSLIRRNNNTCLWEKLDAAEKVIFLGYGFDPFNNDILIGNNDNLKNLIEKEKLYATGINLNPGFINKINSLSNDSNYLPIQNKDCLQLMEELFPPPFFSNEV